MAFCSNIFLLDTSTEEKIGVESLISFVNGEAAFPEVRIIRLWLVLLLVTLLQKEATELYGEAPRQFPRQRGDMLRD